MMKIEDISEDGKLPVKLSSTGVSGTTWDRRTGNEFSYSIKMDLRVMPKLGGDERSTMSKEFEDSLQNAIRCAMAWAMSLLEK